MLSIKNLESFTKQTQTSVDNVIREYCQHLFLSYLYKQPGSERLLFKGGTALRIVFDSPRFSEDLDFDGARIRQKEVETIFTDALADIEHTGIAVEIDEGKNTSGGYLGIASFSAYGNHVPIRIEVSLRTGGTRVVGTRALIESDYLPAYTLVHVPKDALVKGKMQALINRHKPRDFYDYFFMLSGNYPRAKEKDNLIRVRALLKDTKINFRNELREFLPASHAMHLRDFRTILLQKIEEYL